jgi:tetratricopeptide (TPR) repeat protein
LLDAALERCIERNEPEVALITAPPGGGKSRLRHEFLRRLGARNKEVFVITALAAPVGAGSPYALLGQALRRLCEIQSGTAQDMQILRLQQRIAERVDPANADRISAFLGELCGISFPDDTRPLLRAARSDPQIMHAQIQRAFIDFLSAECRDRPCLLVLEDLHWGDSPSIDLIDATLRALRESPLFVLGLGRPEVYDAFPRLWEGHAAQRVSLPGLSRKASARLVAAVLGQEVSSEMVNQIVEHAAGNALFLEELIRTVSEGHRVTQANTVLAMLQARLSVLDKSVRRALCAASIFGQTFWRGGILALLGHDQGLEEINDCLAILMQSEAIERHPISRFSEDVEYGFRHILLADAASALLSTTDQEIGHRLACTYLERAGESDPAVLAEHAHRGQDLQRAITFYGLAAEAAFARGDLSGAKEKLERCIACGARGETLGQMLAIKAEFFRWQQEWQAGCDVATQALPLLPAGSIWWCKLVGCLTWMSVNLSRADLMNKVVELLLHGEPQSNARDPFCAAVADVVTMFSMGGARDVVRSFIERLRQIEQTLDEKDVLARGQIGFSQWCYRFLMVPDPWDEYQNTQRAAAAFDQTSSTRMRNFTLWAEATALLALGDYAGCDEKLRICVESAAQLKDTFLMTGARMYPMLCGAERCSPDKLAETEALAEKLISLNEMEVTLGNGYGSLARVRLAQGRLPEAREAAEKALSVFKNILGWRPRVYRTLIQVLLGQGLAQEAVRVGQEAMECIATIGGGGDVEVALRLAVAEAYAENGNQESAEVALLDALKLMERLANRIPDPVLRERFLNAIPDNARVRQLSLAWGLAGSMDTASPA